MRLNISLSFEKAEEKKPLLVLVSKSTGENLPILDFQGKASDDVAEVIQGFDLGELSADEVLLVSIVDFPSANFVVSAADLLNALPGTKHEFTVDSPKVTITLEVATGTETQAVITLDEKFEKAVKFLEEFTIPWYLRSSDLYTSTKTTLSKITVPTVDDETQKFIDQFSNFLQSSIVLLRNAGVPIISQEEIKVGIHLSYAIHYMF